MTTTLDKLDLTDKYHDALRTMIEAKIAGKEIGRVEEIEKPAVDIMTALKKSIEQARSQRKPMEKGLGDKGSCGEGVLKPSQGLQDNLYCPQRWIIINGKDLTFSTKQQSKFGLERVKHGTDNANQTNLSSTGSGQIETYHRTSALSLRHYY